MKLVAGLLIISLSFQLGGCATIDARIQNGFGHPFIASENGVAHFAFANLVTLSYFFPALVITVPVTAMDLALGVVTDTVLLPADLLVEPAEEHRKVAYENLKL